MVLYSTIKTYGNLSNINIRYYLKHRRAILYRKFFKKPSENQENVKSLCTGLNNLFHLHVESGSVQ